MTTSFADLGVPDHLVASLAERGIHEPTPIQIATIPDALAGRDLCGKAPTGSGKTIAFGIPLVLGAGRAESRRPRALVLVPTRELASQVRKELAALAGHGKPSVEAIYGGVGFDRQIKKLHRGVDIVVACPGRLADLINQRHIQLGAVQHVVIDEADRMADMGFLPEVRRLLDQCPDDRQTVLFSATLDGDVDVLIKKYQHDPARHAIESHEDHEGEVDHYFWRVERTDKVATTAQVINRLGQTVVFCRTKRGADRLARQLENAGVPSAAIHGDRSQNQRERALSEFHQGRVAALVATDVAARGIHVDDVGCVVHFDPPEDGKAYVHRSGRTGRAGARGVVVSLVPADVRKPVNAIQKELGFPARIVDIDLDQLGEPGTATTLTLAARPVAEARPRPERGRSDRDRGARGHDRDRPGRERTRSETGSRPAKAKRPAGSKSARSGSTTRSAKPSTPSRSAKPSTGSRTSTPSGAKRARTGGSPSGTARPSSRRASGPSSRRSR